MTITFHVYEPDISMLGRTTQNVRVFWAYFDSPDKEKMLQNEVNLMYLHNKIQPGQNRTKPDIVWTCPAGQNQTRAYKRPCLVRSVWIKNPYKNRSSFMGNMIGESKTNPFFFSERMKTVVVKKCFRLQDRYKLLKHSVNGIFSRAGEKINKQAAL